MSGSCRMRCAPQDKDRSNSIDKDEMKQVMQMMGLEAKDETIAAMVRSRFYSLLF